MAFLSNDKERGLWCGDAVGPVAEKENQNIISWKPNQGISLSWTCNLKPLAF